jgi:hypothetical protein
MTFKLKDLINGPNFLSGKEQWQCEKSYKKYWRRTQDSTTWPPLKPSTLLTGVAAMATPHQILRACGMMGTPLRMCWPRLTASQVGLQQAAQASLVAWQALGIECTYPHTYPSSLPAGFTALTLAEGLPQRTRAFVWPSTVAHTYNSSYSKKRVMIWGQPGQKLARPLLSQ